VIQAKNLCFCYGNNANSPVLTGVNLSIERGRITALLGESGAGKSTLIGLLVGLMQPSSGSVAKPNQLAMGVALQPAGFWWHLSVARHLKLVLAGRGLGQKMIHQRIDEILDRFDLLAYAKKRPAKLSSGQRQRLALARAMVHQPDWLFLDEPLAHLDPQAREVVLAELRKEVDARNTGVFVVTHHTQGVDDWADEICHLADGQMAPNA